MDFTGVTGEGTTLLSGSEKTVLYDENVNPFEPKPVLPREPTSSIPDSNDNVYSGSSLVDGAHVSSPGYNVKSTEAKQLRANRRSFTVRKDIVPEAPGVTSDHQKFPENQTSQLRANRRSFTVRKDIVPEAPGVTSDHQKFPENQTSQQKTNLNTTVSAPESPTEACADLCIKSEDLPRDSEAGPEVAQFSEEEFRCASEHFKDPSAFDFLQKFGDSKQLGRSSLGRCSLFLKFDPLLADGRPSLVVSTEEVQNEKSPAAGRLSNIPGDELINWSNSPKVVLQDPSQDLLEHSPVAAETFKVKKEDQMFSEKEMSQALKFQELMFQERLLKKDQECSEVKKKAEHRAEEDCNFVRNMYAAVKDMAKACDAVGKERQRLLAENDKLSKERDQAVEDLRGVEAAFSDFYRRYEQAKDIIRALKENEDLLKNQLTESQSNVEKRDQMLSTLKAKAEESIVTANREVENSRKTRDTEVTVLTGQLRKAEMKITSLEKHLEQKTEEVGQLTQMYDDLLSKVQQN